MKFKNLKIVGFITLVCNLAYATEQPKWDDEGWVRAQTFKIKPDSSNVIYEFNGVHKDMAKVENKIKEKGDTNYAILRFSIVDANKNVISEEGIKLIKLGRASKGEIVFSSGIINKETQVSDTQNCILN